MTEQQKTYEEAVTSLYEHGPGGICEECGHFAIRHDDTACHFPRNELNPPKPPCECKGMLWYGHRVKISDVTRP